MVYCGILVRTEREGISSNLDLTEMTKIEIKEWIRHKQERSPDFDIDVISTLCRIFRETIVEEI